MRVKNSGKREIFQKDHLIEKANRAKYVAVCSKNIASNIAKSTAEKMAKKLSLLFRP